MILILRDILQLFSEIDERAHCIKEICFRPDQPICVFQSLPFFCHALSSY